ncbi:hypothetical protein JOF36_001311 [Pseudonocardia parietis]|uniref:Uncharacterized protein n=1 Tax=Pseudonocardia parietis TaxID=570936 RepID=A0ABS4VNW4_9PSEU|nr:hypothetical protein [Pseudonocardia parietis]
MDNQTVASSRSRRSMSGGSASTAAVSRPLAGAGSAVRRRDRSDLPFSLLSHRLRPRTVRTGQNLVTGERALLGCEQRRR